MIVESVIVEALEVEALLSALVGNVSDEADLDSLHCSSSNFAIVFPVV